MHHRNPPWSRQHRWSLVGLAVALGGAAGLVGLSWALGGAAGGTAPPVYAYDYANLVVPATALPVRSVGPQRAVLGRAPASEPIPRRGRRLARAFARGRSSAGFERRAYVGNVLAAEPGAVGALEAFLGDWRAMRAAGERTAAIDLLEAVARQEGDTWESMASDAEEALAELVSAPLPAEAVPEARRALGAEKHQALLALTRVDSLRALRVYAALPRSALAAAMQDALVAGLTDNGLPRAQALARVREASSRASSP